VNNAVSAVWTSSRTTYLQQSGQRDGVMYFQLTPWWLQPLSQPMTVQKSLA